MPAPNIGYQQLPGQTDRTGQTDQSQDYLRQQYDVQVKVLENTPMSDSEFNTKLLQLQAGTKMQWNKLQYERRQKASELEQVQRLIRGGTRGMGREQEAAVRMRLGPEAEKLAFPKQKFLDPTYLRSKGFRENLLGYANAAPDQRGFEWGPPKKKREDLIVQYQRWQESELYHQEKSPQEQRQLDREWDMAMRESRAYSNWFTDKNMRVLPTAVTALRSKGRIADAMRSRVVTKTPMASSISTQLNKQKRNAYNPFENRIPAPAKAPAQSVIRQRNRITGEIRISYDGGESWQ